MHLRIWERVLVAVAGLLLALVSLCVLCFGIGLFPFALNTESIASGLLWWQRAILIAAALCVMALGVFCISVLLKRRKEKGFVIQRTEYGDMSISMNAMETMVQKCVETHQEVKAESTRIHHSRDGVQVDLKLTLPSGTNIPLTVNALQKQIKQYITSCSGVEVQEVRVMVETDTARLMAPPPEADEIPDSVLVREEELAPVSDPLFSHTEEPETYAQQEKPEDVPMPETAAAETVEEPSAEPLLQEEIPAAETQFAVEAPEAEETASAETPETEEAISAEEAFEAPEEDAMPEQPGESEEQIPAAEPQPEESSEEAAE